VGRGFSRDINRICGEGASAPEVLESKRTADQQQEIDSEKGKGVRRTRTPFPLLWGWNKLCPRSVSGSNFNHQFAADRRDHRTPSREQWKTFLLALTSNFLFIRAHSTLARQFVWRESYDFMYAF
jgi:hypothetical protein